MRFAAKEAEAGTVEVTMSVELKGVLLPAESYGELKDFLSWVEDATQRTISLERAR